MNNQAIVDVAENLEICHKSPKRIFAYCETGGWVKERLRAQNAHAIDIFRVFARSFSQAV